MTFLNSHEHDKLKHSVAEENTDVAATQFMKKK